MTDREKLIGLLDEATDKLKELCGGYNDGTGNTVRADHLIANGVTFATDTNVGDKWISVNDPPEKKGCYLVTVKHWCDGKPVVREAFYTISGWISCEKGVDITPRVTHWQYLPQPPKGE